MTELTPEQYSEAREKMVNTQLVATGVRRQSIINRASEIKREDFTPTEFKLIAYSAKEIPLQGSRFMLDPMNLGLILDRIDFDDIQNMLIIGDSSGYVSALLAGIVPNIVSVDSVEGFKNTVDKLLAEININNVHAIQGDLTKGHASEGPYDLIFINGAVQIIPDALFAQLSPKGKILTTLKKAFISHAVFQHKAGDTVQTEKLFECSVSLLPEFGKQSKFVF